MQTNKKKQVKKSDTIKKENYGKKWEHIFGKKWTENEINFLADEMLEWFETETEDIDKWKGRLWLKDFATQKRLTRQRISEFKEKNEYFRNIYDICNQIQESKLFKLGLTLKSTMPLFALKNVAGWRNEDKSENEETTNKPIQIEIIKS